jgi:hypothetical protein
LPQPSLEQSPRNKKFLGLPFGVCVCGACVCVCLFDFSHALTSLTKPEFSFPFRVCCLCVCVCITQFNPAVKGRECNRVQIRRQHVDRRAARYSFAFVKLLISFFFLRVSGGCVEVFFLWVSYDDGLVFSFTAEDKRSRLRPLSFSGLPTKCLSPSSAIAPIHSFPM